MLLIAIGVTNGSGAAGGGIGWTGTGHPNGGDRVVEPGWFRIAARRTRGHLRRERCGPEALFPPAATARASSSTHAARADPGRAAPHRHRPRRTRALGYIARAARWMSPACCLRTAAPGHTQWPRRPRRWYRCGGRARRRRTGRGASAGRSTHRDDGRVTTVALPSAIVRTEHVTKVYQRDSIRCRRCI